MQKPLTLDGKGLSDEQFTTIVPQSFTKNQSSTTYSHRRTVDYPDSDLTRLIQQYRLTDCLECLEMRGYYGDAAILMISYAQLVGGVA